MIWWRERGRPCLWTEAVTLEPRRKRKGLRKWLIAGGAAGAVFLFLAALAGIVADRNQSGPSPSPLDATPDPAIPRTVFTYFYYWYDLPDGPHSGALTDRPADPFASYQDIAWFRRQLADMTDAGIDIALAVYWGPFEPSSDTGLANLAKAAGELRDEGSAPPKVGMFLDTGAIARMPEGERNLTKEENQDEVYDLVHTFYTILPRENWALIKERPVVWLWGNYFEIPFDQSFFDRLTERFLADFGSEPYIVADVSWRHPIGDGFLSIGKSTETAEEIVVDQYYAWGAALNGMQAVGGVAEVGPGFDERQLDGPDRSGRYAEREGGDFYRRSLEAAIDSGKRLLAIETWNEFHEATDIADSIEYGRTYIEITREYADRFKSLP